MNFCCRDWKHRLIVGVHCFALLFAPGVAVAATAAALATAAGVVAALEVVGILVLYCGL